jgi:hypothetical protein
MLPSLVDVFEEDPVAEAAALGALAVRFHHTSSQLMSWAEGVEHF